MMTEDAVRVGAFTVSMDAAERWIGEYFDEAVNRDTASRRGREHSPYAYPVYDRYQAGSGPAELTDADLLAPLLLNAAQSLTCCTAEKPESVPAQELMGRSRGIWEQDQGVGLCRQPVDDLRSAQGDIDLIPQKDECTLRVRPCPRSHR
ncbi:DUF6308 family protein [Actinacidiphila glaucinigra]|uniref:DUF6308 family protein n=1 Tax=Actinacidiphila glaucinigra TaxID=235986 RepID=UPI000B78D7A0